MEEKELIKIFEKLVEDCNRVSEGMQYAQDLQVLSKARKALKKVKKNGVLHSVSESFNSDLRNRFFKECTDPSPDSGKNAGIRKVNMTAHDLFEWFKSNVR